MDFKNLMSLASHNQQNSVNKVRNKKSKNCSSGVSSSAVEAFLARQNAEKARKKEQEEIARRERIQARLQGKQSDKCKNKKIPETSMNVSVKQEQRSSGKVWNAPASHNLNGSLSKNQSKSSSTQRKNTTEKVAKYKDSEKMIKKVAEKLTPPERKKVETKVKKPVQPALSFQELMNVAKQQADNPNAFQSNQNQVIAPKTRQNFTMKSSPVGEVLFNKISAKRKREISEANNRNISKTNRGKNPISQEKEIVERNKEKNLDTAKGKKFENGNQKRFEIKSGKEPHKLDKRDDRMFPVKTENNGNCKLSEKPKFIERQTLSQRVYRSATNYRGRLQGKRYLDAYVEDEEDDDMDEFIDDGEEEPTEAVSNCIKEIFGYDRNRFRDREEDISNMESSYGDIQREEAKSLRIAKLEDEVERLKESYELQQQQRKKKKLKH